MRALIGKAGQMIAAMLESIYSEQENLEAVSLPEDQHAIHFDLNPDAHHTLMELTW